MIGQTISNCRIVIKLGGACNACALALDWSHRVPRPRWAILVQAVVLVLVVLAPKAQAQGLTTPPAAAATSSSSSPADRVYRNGVIFTAVGQLTGALGSSAYGGIKLQVSVEDV